MNAKLLVFAPNLLGLPPKPLNQPSYQRRDLRDKKSSGWADLLEAILRGMEFSAGPRV